MVKTSTAEEHNYVCPVCGDKLKHDRVGRGFCVHYSNPNCVLRHERDPEDERTTDLAPRHR
jgi:hypothetical protein